MSSSHVTRPGTAEALRPARAAARRWLARGLRSASATLARLARRLAEAPRPGPQALPRLEFYAQASAPEGALYLDGTLVGWLEGVRRL